MAAGRITEARMRLKAEGGKQVAGQLDQVGKATDRLGRNQTRLGQASASAGRSFSAQAAGLGGVVGVYAAAAANVFALTAAFAALNRAAQFETILRGTESLANAVGTNAESVVKSLQNITAGQLSVIEAATQANLALSAGFNVDQIEQLGEVALKASRALGRNLTDSFQRITRGAIKLEPELLDEIGIFTRIDPAVNAYAASLNKSAASLTQFEKRQAFVNQVIKDGQAAFSDITDTGESTQEVFERLVANFQNLALAVGKVLADSLVPFAKFLDDNLGNRLALLGGIGLLVFGRLKTAIGSFATEGLAALGQRLSQTADSFANTTRNAAEFAKQAAAANAAFVGGGALPGAGRAAGADIKRNLAGGGFTTQQALSVQKQIPQLLKNEEAVQAALKKNIDDKVISQKNFSKEIEQSRIRVQGLAATEALVNDQLSQSSNLAKKFAGALNGVASAAAVASVFIGRAFAVLQAIVIAVTAIQLVGSLFDFDLVGKLSETYKNLTANTRRTKEGFEALIDAAKPGTAAFNNFTAGVEGTNEELREAIILSKELSGQSIKRLQNDLEGLRSQLATQEEGGFLAFLLRDLSNAFDSEQQIAELEKRIRAIQITLSPTAQNATDLALAIGTLAETSDVASSSLGSAAANGILKVDRATKQVTLSLSEGTLEFGNFSDGVSDTEEKFAKGGAVAADFGVKLLELNRKLTTGEINADKAGSSFGVLANQAAKAAELLKDGGFTEGAEVVVDSLDRARETTGKLVNEIVALDQFGKAIAKTFGSAFKEVDDALLSGTFGLDGTFAKSSEERAKNQSLLFLNLKEQLKVQEEIANAEQFSTQESAKLTELRARESQIVKATEGRQLKLLDTLEKQRIAQEKKTKQLQNQLNVLLQQNAIAEKGLEITQAQNDLSVERARQDAQLKQNEALLKLGATRKKINEDQQQSAINLLQIEQKLGDAIAKQADAQKAISDSRARLVLQRRKESADQAVDTAEMRGISTPREMANLRLAAAEAASKLELFAIEQRKQAAIEEFVKGNQQIDNRVDLLNKEFNLTNEKRKNQIEALQLEQGTESIKTRNALANITAQENIIQKQTEQAGQQRELADLQAQIAKDSQLAEIELQKKQATLIKERIEADKKILEGNIKILRGYRDVAEALTGDTLPEIEVDATGINTKNIDSIITNFGKQITKTEAIYTQNITAAELAEKTALSGLKAQSDKLNIEKGSIEEVAALEKEERSAKIKALEAERVAEQILFDKKIELAGVEKDTLTETLLLKMQQAGIDKETALTALDNIRKRTEYELSQRARLDAALAQTQAIVENNFTNAFTNLNEQLIDGTITMDSVGQTFKDMMGNMLREVQSAVFKKTIAEPIAGEITKFLPALFNSGGPVHLAGGGTMKRDRVAAMLEPGEFVIRKEAAKKLGMSKLKDMNAGIKPDPLAMLIAQFGGSKVKGLAAGGGPAGSAGQSGSGDHGGTSAAGPSDGGSSMGMSPGRSMAEFGHIGFAGTTSSSTSSGSGGSSGRTTTSATAAQVQAAMDRSRATGRTIGVVDAPDTEKGRQDLVESIRSEQEKAERAATRGKKGSFGKRALATTINALVGLVPAVGIAHSAQSAITGESLGKGLTDADPFGFAAGGPVHMAAGGAMKRDRVPALLEPGEFVIRKPMAKAIGGKALGAMNATGSVSPGNVSVNINNQGSPKGATVMPPRMNGDKMIIDVITRDLRNNGTLRKSLRGGNY